ncbi:xanthomonalisin [Dokdonella fugitiva]|uniref:Xanthomonalisin n=1 Tax=Dokdonella fugitiva TaxID=328517 RepID=A0A839EVZ8_9GAMM|nr:pre-peptidase C-terminal domain-containing protein [Dokdonella fugitiva]MBA8888767.1 xanthomonalisin [Dokdonella fugitiva]
MRNSRITTRPAVLAAAVVMAFGAASAVGAASLSPAQLSPATALRSGENIDGMVPFTQPVHIEVALKMRDRAGLDSYIASAANAQRITGVRPMLSTDEVMQRHAPTDDQVKAVVDFLTSAGFKNVVVADNRMLVSADGTADVAQAAFQTSLARVTRKDGSGAIANTSPVHIPASLQGIVLAVLGLQDVHRPHVMSQVLDGPQPQAVTGHFPNEFSSIYSGTGVATGAGVTVGIITQGKLTQTITDLNSFTAAHGFATVTTQTVNTGGTSNDTSGIGEWNLDSQDVVGMAGGQVGKIIFYNEPTLANSALTANINTAVTANAAKIINMSLGECETDAHSDGSDAADDQLFATAVAQGQTFSISTGDSGADECGDGGTKASNPANSPYVVAVAGTTLNASTSAWSSETVWSGSGGSESTIEPKPSWQTLWSGTHRGVADVAFDADPNSGAKVIVNGGSQQIGGTSLAAPIFSGLWARVIAVKGTSVGFAGPIIYQLPAGDFHDVTSGSNGISAGPGYDLASGRGSIILSSAINHIGGGGGGNVAPVANFSFTTNALVASFTDSSTDSDGTIASRSWTFGDGGTSTATNPSHTYASAGTYSVSLTVTDNGGATNTKTSSVTVTGGGGGGGNVLQNGVAVTGLTATTGNQLAYTMVVPAGATNLKFVTSGGSGDGDLYVKFGSAPTTSSYDCRSWVSGNSETCSITTAQAGTYYVMINAYSTFSGMSLTGSYTAGGGGGGGTTLSNGVPVTGLAATAGNWTSDYTLVVPSGATNLKFQISGGTGDADLYVRLNAAPTTSSYTCRPYLSGNSETCTFSAPTAGTYHVRINAYATFSGVTLTPSFTP